MKFPAVYELSKVSLQPPVTGLEQQHDLFRKIRVVQAELCQVTIGKCFTYFPSYKPCFKSNLPVLPHDKVPKNSAFYLQTAQPELLIAAIKIKTL